MPSAKTVSITENLFFSYTKDRIMTSFAPNFSIVAFGNILKYKDVLSMLAINDESLRLNYYLILIILFKNLKI